MRIINPTHIEWLAYTPNKVEPGMAPTQRFQPGAVKPYAGVPKVPALVCFSSREDSLGTAAAEMLEKRDPTPKGKERKSCTMFPMTNMAIWQWESLGGRKWKCQLPGGTAEIQLKRTSKIRPE